MEHYHTKYGSVGVGWRKIVDPLIEMVEAEGGLVTQIKEKFGTLRFYTGAVSDETYDAIDKAEKLSASTCESCGKPGILRSGSWLKTLCDECDKERK